MRFKTTITELLFAVTADEVHMISPSLIDLFACDVWVVPMSLHAALARGCRERALMRAEPLLDSDRVPLFSIRLHVDRYMPEDRIVGIRGQKIVTIVAVEAKGGTDAKS